MTKAVARMRLEKCTRPDSDIRKLGERLLEASLTTGAIAHMFPFRPSILAQARRTFRPGDCWGECFRATKIPGSTPQYSYEVVTRED